MRLSPKQLLRRSRAALGCGLAVLAAAVATAEPASAQRRSHGDVRQTTSSRSTTSLHVQIGRGYNGGHYETRNQRVWVPGFSRQVWVPPSYAWHYDSCGNRHQVLVHAGHYRTERTPGRYETRREQVWVPARRIHIDRRSGRNYGQQRNRVTHVGRRYRR